MRVPVWAYDLARGFWDAVGEEEGFPRELEDAIESAYPLTVKRLARLTLGSLREWLESLGIPVNSSPDRPLCGFLAANRGSAILFVDANDAPDEQRYSLAHELAHFLRDVWRPRQRIGRVLGEAGKSVSDGCRPASQDERLAAALEGIDLAVHVHLLPRDADGRPATAVIADAEESADVLAFELLAPATHLAGRAVSWSTKELVNHLCIDYGMPRREAARYAERLRPPAPRPDAWLEALRASH
jgi:Zn-dependent peptidase ImmA (M78 family)